MSYYEFFSCIPDKKDVDNMLVDLLIHAFCIFDRERTKIRVEII